jgi:hypothetical protein
MYLEDVKNDPDVKAQFKDAIEGFAALEEQTAKNLYEGLHTEVGRKNDKETRDFLFRDTEM